MHKLNCYGHLVNEIVVQLRTVRFQKLYAAANDDFKLFCANHESVQ